MLDVVMELFETGTSALADTLSLNIQHLPA
jgi:hypothetical protein